MASVPGRIERMLYIAAVGSILLGCDTARDRNANSPGTTVETYAVQPTSERTQIAVNESSPSTINTDSVQPATTTPPQRTESIVPIPTQFLELEAKVQSVAIALAKLGGQVEVGVGEKVISVDLDGRDIRDEQLSQLAALSDLKSLNLSNTGITDVGLNHLANLKKLKFLYLFGTRLTDSGMPSIATLPRLEVLCLDSTEITDLGLKTLEDLPRLEKLHVHSRAKITDVGLESLHRHVRLFELRIGGPHISEKAVDALKAALPNCNIVYDPQTEAKPE